MSLKKQAKSGVAILIATLVVAMLIAAYSINEIRIGGPLQTRNQENSDLLADILPPPEYIVESWLEVSLIKANEGSTQQHLQKLERLKSDFETRKAYWAGVDLTDTVREQFNMAQRQADRFWTVVDSEFVPAARRGDPAQLDATYAKLAPLYTAHREAIDTLVTTANAQTQTMSQSSSKTVTYTIVVLGFIMTGLIGMMFYGSRLLNLRIIGPLSDSAALMNRMAGGDYRVQVPGSERPDEIGEMARAMEVFRTAGQERAAAQAKQDHVVQELAGALEQLASGNLANRIDQPFASEYERLRVSYNEAIAGLDESLSRVSGSAQSVHAGSSEIRAASEDLARRTEQQAASIEDAAGAMNQVTTMVAESARSALDVRSAISTAHGDAKDGGEVVRKAVAAMDGIERSSQEIGNIINVIDGIAFQTNLLALNAGVEAARAGDAGKGFAVVANEVRALAQRSADAAKDIKALITTSSEQVSQGVSLVGETGKMLERIVTKIGDINGLVAEMAQRAEDEAENLTRVNGSVSDMDRTIQQNAAMVEESTAAARSLAGEADQLAALVGRFRLSSASGMIHQLRAAAPVRRAPAPRRPQTSGNLALSVDDQDWTEF